MCSDKRVEITYKGNDKWEVYVRDITCNWFDVDSCSEFQVVEKVKDKMLSMGLSYREFKFVVYKC